MRPPCVIWSYASTYMQNHNDTINKQMSEDFFRKICTSHFIVRVRKGYSRFYGERELDTEQNCNILTPTLMAVSVVSFSFSRAAQPEAHGPISLLDDGFLYCILSPTGLQNSIGGPEGPFGRVWLSLPHLVSNSVRSQSEFLSWPNYIIVQRPLNLWNGMFDRNQAEITVMHFRGHSLPVYQSMSASWAFYLVPFHQPNPPTQSLSIAGHWNVSLPSNVLSWNGMFARAEGQNTTLA